MSRLVPVALVAAAAAAFLLAPVTGTADQQKDGAPDIGLDYRALIREQLDLVGKGEGGKAMELAVKHALAPETFPEAKREEFKKSFALIFATAGKYGGCESVGYKRLGSRFLKVYSLLYFEKGVLTITHVFAKNAEGAWKLSGLTVTDSNSELDAATPLVAFPPVKD